MKWWDRPLGRSEVVAHRVWVYGRGEVGGIFISASGYHASAIDEAGMTPIKRVIEGTGRPPLFNYLPALLNALHITLKRFSTSVRARGLEPPTGFPTKS
jgi:hypothetical protein